MDHIKTSDRLLLLSDEELSRRLGHIDAAMTASGLDSNQHILLERSRILWICNIYQTVTSHTVDGKTSCSA